MPHSYDEIDKVFFNDGYRLAKDILGNDPDRDRIILLVGNLYDVIDKLLYSFTSRLQKEKHSLACKRGCSWCCTQPVFTDEWETNYLKHFMKKRFTGDRLTEIKDKTKKKNMEVSALSPAEQLKTRIPCPLLFENICSVYPARPMACRIYLSSDVDSCIEEFRNPGNNTNYAKLFDFPLHAGRKMNEGIAAWYTEIGYQVGELRLEEGLNGIWE